MKPLEVISLFAGIGGIDLGLERAGMQCVAQVEIDDYASKVLAKHWPNVIRFRDVRECGAHNLPRADVIAGGFPCQDISDAGRQAGIEGARSGLWSEYARIIRELQPRYVLVENVAALLYRGLGRVLGDLAELGYDAEWSVLSACTVGATHTRERLFIVAYANGLRQLRGRVSESGEESTPWRNASQRTQHSKARERSYPLSGWWSVEPSISRMAYGVPARLDRLKGVGNAVVPQCAELVGRMIVAHAEGIAQ